MRIPEKNNFADFIKNSRYQTMVEIGTGTGDFSEFILQNTNIKKLYCIDKWEDWNKKKSDGLVHYIDNNGSERFRIAQEKLKKFGDRVELIKEDSEKASALFKNNQIDACCIDGNLSDNAFLQDLQLWFSKVKTNGIIFGFEYEESVETNMFNNSSKRRYRKILKSNTKRILDFFIKQRGCKLNLTTRGKKCWFIIKEDVLIIDKIDKDILDLEICIHTHHYQRRLCWMLSSILQQKGKIPNITINISHSENDGNPTTKEVCSLFGKEGLNIKEIILTDKQVSNRAIARNIQVKETVADWMLFADSDMVYDPYFFEDIQNQLKGKFALETKCIGADRISLDIPFCIKYFENDDTKYPCVIPNVADICAKWPVKHILGRNVAAGNFQLANVNAIKLRGNKYTHREGDLWRGTKSDRHFRCIMGGRCPMTVKPQYHLNHDRGGPDIPR